MNNVKMKLVHSFSDPIFSKATFELWCAVRNKITHTIANDVTYLTILEVRELESRI